MPPPPSGGDATSDGGGQDDIDDDDKTPRDRPAEPDRIYAPGERDDEDQEADEFLADVLASATVSGVIKGVNKNLAKKNPPQRSKPHPTTVRWGQEGLSYRLEKLMGRGVMGPNAKLALGFGGMILTMYLNAEDIPAHERGAPRPPSTDARASGPAAPAPHANGAAAAPASSAASSPDAPAAETKSLEPLGAAVGTFRRSN